MKVTFVSNYINHHQIPFCQAMLGQGFGEFVFVQTQAMDPERVRMGWEVDVKAYPFVLCYYENPQAAQELIMDSDAVLFGGTDDESYIEPRLKSGKLVIRISERIYKEGQWKFISPRGLIKKYKDHVRYRRKEVYLLCAGGYVASDFHLIHAYPDKMYVWGYFPEFVEYSAERLQRNRRQAVVEILWAGRMIDWKHPEAAVHMAEALAKKDRQGKPSFHLTMIGDGELRETLQESVKDKGLEAYVSFAGFMEPARVRENMLDSDIFLFTSDEKEGWGAVLNESMNSGCAVVASSGIGAVPFLLRHEKNGMVYRTGCEQEMISYVEELMEDSAKRHRLGQSAYETVANKWNAQQAAGMLVRFIRSALLGSPEAAIDGPVSKAPVISPRAGYRYTRDPAHR